MMPSFSYVRVTSLKDAVQQLSTGDARILAGGTDLLGCMRDRVFEAGKIVSISRLKDLSGISETVDGGLRIGALTSITEVAGHPAIRKHYTALAQAAAEVGSPQLRNQGTIGGNICQKPRCWYYRGEFYCLRKGGPTCYAIGGENQYHCIFGGEGCYIVHPSDPATALLALGARVRIAGPDGIKTVSIGDFHVPPSKDVRKETILMQDDIVTEIILPRAEGIRSSFRKVRERGSWDFALASTAMALRFSDSKVTGAAVVLGAAAPVPWRSREAEESVIGQELTPGTVKSAADAALRNALPLKHNAYKIPLFRGLIKEELLAMKRT